MKTDLIRSDCGIECSRLVTNYENTSRRKEAMSSCSSSKPTVSKTFPAVKKPASLNPTETLRACLPIATTTDNVSVKEISFTNSIIYQHRPRWLSITYLLFLLFARRFLRTNRRTLVLVLYMNELHIKDVPLTSLNHPRTRATVRWRSAIFYDNQSLLQKASPETQVQRPCGILCIVMLHYQSWK